MSRVFSRLTGSGAGGNWSTSIVTPDQATRTGFYQPSKDDIDLLALGFFGRNRYIGGSRGLAIDASAAGSFDIDPCVPFVLDNSNNQFSDFSDSNGASLIVQVRFRVRVSDISVSITPRIFDETANAAATISGAVACTADDATYAGTNQQQTVTLTVPSGIHTFRPQVTIGGTPAAGLYAYCAVAVIDVYINS